MILYKMKETVNNVLLAGDKCMPEMHVKAPGFTYSSCGSFTQNKERIQKFKEAGDTRYIYKNKLDKACFRHDMAYDDFKDLAKRTASDKGLNDKAFNIAKNPKHDKYQRLAFMVCKFFDKKPSGSGVRNEIKQSEQLGEELHKLVIRKFMIRRLYSSFKDSIWGADLADMQLISKF